MISQAFRSLGYYFKALPLISELRLWKYVFISALISLAVAAISLYSSSFVGEFISNFLSGFYRWETGSGIFGTITKWLSTILTGLAFLFLLRYILLVVLAPIMSFLSEEVEEKYTGQSFNQGFSLVRSGKELVRGLRMALRNITRELLWTALFFVIGFIPIFAPVSLIGNGSLYLALLLIPVIGVIFGPVLGTISATVQAIEDEL